MDLLNTLRIKILHLLKKSKDFYFLKYFLLFLFLSASIYLVISQILEMQLDL